MQTEAGELRTKLRAMIDERLPADFVGSFTGDSKDLATAEDFCRQLAEDKLLCMAWPEAYGGQDAGPWLQTIVREEMWAHFEPRGAQYMGVNWVGPVIMRHGTEEQKSEHLPRISAGEVIWCQGFSEPEAGSDLSGLRTTATPDGDGYRINGQKVWTSYASIAGWCFLLARTERNPADLRSGITVFLVKTDSPGFSVRPLDSLVGHMHLNEVFFSDVYVPASQVLGEVGQGWRIVMEVLAYERLGIARYSKCDRLLAEVRTHLGEEWNDVPSGLRERWVRALVRTRQSRLLAYRVVAAQAAGHVDPADVAAYRIAVTVLDQEVSEILTEIVGPKALSPGLTESKLVRAVEDHWRYALAGTVSSGTIEMQRRALARAILAPA
ncbi:acyl-CoA dehydrogenase family protein [Aeromicrobium wangtongii]|uniref:Acyl-CoA dehydrogenase family protein n=1 Tax=Aeromicrobium wangtongii TaxID=2969247 RepID=A0ABY5MFE6_9ACTN|nr:acyl-CoA dehydrogenase family protein [Aeromicrobium wangtongii]MCD9196953.1 acyl-CoA dehydrogenase family protein [Aeromicrobium wangtongii]UUP15477.1 acyl-CoA dehydrogenase family protein [Aeromicrobium wangtongii]